MDSAHQTKGIDFIGMVKALRAWRRANPGQGVPGLMPEDMDFLDNTLILSIDWYPHDRFLRFLDATAALVFGGTREGMLEMGRVAARALYTTVHSSLIYKGAPLHTLRGGINFIKTHFNFGEWIFLEESKTRAQIKIIGYPEMNEAHGTLLIGWCEVMIQLSGGAMSEAKILKAPWRGDEEYLLDMAW